MLFRFSITFPRCVRPESSLPWGELHLASGVRGAGAPGVLVTHCLSPFSLHSPFTGLATFMGFATLPSRGSPPRGHQPPQTGVALVLAKEPPLLVEPFLLTERDHIPLP